jgi:hypothetical protein
MKSKPGEVEMRFFENWNHEKIHLKVFFSQFGEIQRCSLVPNNRKEKTSFKNLIINFLQPNYYHPHELL